MIEHLRLRWASSRWGGHAGTDAWFLVYGGLLIGLYTKLDFLLGRFETGLRSPVVEHPLFPAFFLNGRVALIAYALPFLSLALLWRPSAVRRQWAALAVTLGSGLLLLHVEGYNDATFTTGVWIGLWLLWWAGRADSAGEAERHQAIVFGKAIVGLFFLGGAVGKLTTEYWDGTALYQLYFVQKGQFPFTYLREAFSEEWLQVCAVYFSRVTVVLEILLGTILFWPLRWAAAGIVLMIMGMVFLSHIQLFSVVGPLLVLMFGLLRLESRGSLEAAKV